MSIPPPEIIVVGSSNTDLVVRVSKLPRPAETILGGDFYQAAGGKGANQVVAAARASCNPVCFVASLGDDAFGAASLASLHRENLNCEHLQITHDAPSGVALILVDHQGQNQIAVAPGANLSLCPKHIDGLPTELWQSAKILLASLEVPLETVLRALELAKRHGLRTILNPAPAQPAVSCGKLLTNVDLLTPNELEASLLTGLDVRTELDARRAAKQLAVDGCDVVITLGALGALVHSLSGPPVLIPAYPVEPVDTVAAGDTLNGALAVALAEGQPLVDAVRWSMRAAALSVTRRGAQPSLPMREEIDAFTIA